MSNDDIDIHSVRARVRTAFAEVLKRGSIDDADSFLNLGGDSLSAMSVVTRLCTELSCEFGIAELFQHPDVESLSQYLYDLTDQDAQNKTELDSLIDDLDGLDEATLAKLLQQ